MIINNSKSLGPYGELHVTSHHGRLFDKLRKICQETACDATHVVGQDGLSFIPQIHALLQQKNHHEPVMLTKFPDGYCVHTPSNIVLSLLKDEHLCKPAEINSEKGKTFAFSLVSPPGLNVHHFKLVKDHNGVLPPSSITNICSVDHALAKISSAIPLTADPRILYSSPNVGNMMGCMLNQDDAQEVKNTFFKLIHKTNKVDMYDRPIKLPTETSKLLRLNDPEGLVCIAPLLNGIAGYRKKTSAPGNAAAGDNVLMFLANSNDFHHDEPCAPSDAQLQVFKMDYTHNAPRVYFNPSESPMASKCKYGSEPIHMKMSVQEALNNIENTMRVAYLDHLGIKDYGAYCDLMKSIRELHAFH